MSGQDSHLTNDLDSWTYHAEKLVSSSSFVYSRSISEDHKELREVEEYIETHKARISNWDQYCSGEKYLSSRRSERRYPTVHLLN